nr:hypothetical protein [Phytoactinopolyspora mesophila]
MVALTRQDVDNSGILHCVLVDEAQFLSRQQVWELTEIKTICHTGAKATMVLRVDDHGRPITEGPQVEIGGNERYISVSRAEFKRMTAGDHGGHG